MKSLLVIQPFSLGDIVYGLQVVQSFAWARPDCRITWLVSEEYAGLVQASPFVRDTMVYAQKAGWKAWFALRRNCETRYFDAVWDMGGVLRSGLLTSAVKAPEKWGRADARQGAGFFYNKRITTPTGPGPHHQLDILQPFLRAAGVPQRLYFPMELKPSQPFGWEEFFGGEQGSTFVMFPDNHKEEKPWPYYSELTAFILKKIPNSRVAWCAAKKALPHCSMPQDSFLNLTGCPLAEMVSLVRQPATFIGTHGGPMYLSAASGNPVLALFGPHDPKQFGPYPLDATKHHVVTAPEGEFAKLTPTVVLAALEELRRRSL